MDRGQSFVAYAHSPKLTQPGDSAFDYPQGLAKIAAMRSTAFSNLVVDAALLQCQSVCMTIVGPIGLNGLGLFKRPPALSSNRINTINQWQEQRDVMPVGPGQNDIDRDALRVDEEVVLTACLTAIGWVRSTFFPPCTARTDELSATIREKSSLSAPRSLSSSTWCSLRHTPAFCQARTRRQHFIPEPHPISCGSFSRGIPYCKTNKVPVRTRLSSSGLWQGCVLRRCLTGSSGRTISHSSSSTSSRAILPRHDNYRRVAMTLKIPFC
jgi:hypothetical protein